MATPSRLEYLKPKERLQLWGDSFFESACEELSFMFHYERVFRRSMRQGYISKLLSTVKNIFEEELDFIIGENCSKDGGYSKSSVLIDMKVFQENFKSIFDGLISQMNDHLVHNSVLPEIIKQKFPIPSLLQTIIEHQEEDIDPSRNSARVTDSKQISQELHQKEKQSAPKSLETSLQSPKMEASSPEECFFLKFKSSKEESQKTVNSPPKLSHSEKAPESKLADVFDVPTYKTESRRSSVGTAKAAECLPLRVEPPEERSLKEVLDTSITKSKNPFTKKSLEKKVQFLFEVHNLETFKTLQYMNSAIPVPKKEKSAASNPKITLSKCSMGAVDRQIVAGFGNSKTSSNNPAMPSSHKRLEKLLQIPKLFNSANSSSRSSGINTNSSCDRSLSPRKK